MPSIINCIRCCLLVICLENIFSSALDACNDRCKNFDNVFCNKGNGVCEDCGVYCALDSNFFNEKKCLEVCPKDPEPMDACSNRCDIYPDTYCNTATLACDSCNIWCTKSSMFFNLDKCSELCPKAITTLPSTAEPSFHTTSTSLTTDRPTDEGVSSFTEPNKQPRVNNTHTTITTPGDQEKNILIICISVSVAGLLALTVVIIFIWNKRKSKCVTEPQEDMENQSMFRNQTAQPGTSNPTGTGHTETWTDKMESSSHMVIGNESPSQSLISTDNSVEE